MRWFLKLSYDGAPFHGWQSQPNAVSVQQTLEEALATVFRRPVPVSGAGRTDTGVNARVMYAHFDTTEDIGDRRRMIISLNRLCGPAISIADIIPVEEEAHARFDATRRTYKYFVAFGKSPFLASMSWLSPSGLDVAAMNEAAKVLIDTDDFTSFAKLHSDTRTNICRVDRSEWSEWHNSFGIRGTVFTISADRFLRNMVRAVTGTLVDVGRGKISQEDFRRIIERKDRCAAGTSMPPQALFLWDVEYPYLNRQTSDDGRN